MPKTFDELFDEACELTRKANRLLVEREKIRQEAASFRFKHQSEIDEMKVEADALAREFKRLYQESQDAYAGGQGAYAKQLSLEGHAKQAECEDLNRQVGRKIEELKEKLVSFYRRADAKQKEADEYYNRAKQIEEELKSRGRTVWARLVVKWTERGYQSDLYVGFEDSGEHLHEFYSLDERGIRKGVVRTDEETDVSTPFKGKAPWQR